MRFKLSNSGGAVSLFHLKAGSRSSRFVSTIMMMAEREADLSPKLLVAVDQQDLARMRTLLHRGASPNAEEDAAHPSGVRGMSGESALSWACGTGFLDGVNVLLDAGAKPNLKVGEFKNDALKAAAVNNEVGAARLILNHGANVNAVNTQGSTALHDACEMGATAAVQLLAAEFGANLNMQTTDRFGFTPLHLAATHGRLAAVHILLTAGAALDIEDKNGRTPAQLALMWTRSARRTQRVSIDDKLAVIELLLRYGASAFLVVRLPNFVHDRDTICDGLFSDPRFVHLIADHGGIGHNETALVAANTRALIFHASIGSISAITSALRAMREVGSDAWCDGGRGVRVSWCDRHIDSTQMLDSELVGNTIQIRLRPPSQLHATSDLVDLCRGCHVVVYGLTSSAGLTLNGKRGKLGGALGAVKPGRYPVFFKGSMGFKQIKPSNLRAIKDPGRAVVAGHEVDALQSVVLRGVTGKCAFANGVYDLDPTHTANSCPVFSLRTVHGNAHMFCGTAGRWCVGNINNMKLATSGQRMCMGMMSSDTISPSPLNLRWRVQNNAVIEHITDPAVTVDTPTWTAGFPPPAWTYHDAVVDSFNPESHEHLLVFQDRDRTTRWFRLDHFRILNWNVLPLRRASVLRTRGTRVVMNILMAMSRVRANSIASEPPLSEHNAPNTAWPMGHMLHRHLRVVMRSDFDSRSIYREHVWSVILAAPSRCPQVAGRIADAKRARARVAAER